MQVFCQRDPRWAHLTIPNSTLTLGRYGCTVSCVAMLTSYFLPERTPAQLLPMLRFAPGGLILWDSCRFENFAWVRRARSYEPSAVRVHILDPSLAVILEVAGGSHWVVATDFTPVSGLIRIADPWLGDRATMARYKGSISGASYFSRR